MKINQIFFFLISGLLIIACKEDEKPAPLPFHGNIYSFTLDSGQVGSTEIVNDYSTKQVKIKVAYGTKLDEVVPTIVISPKATIEPASGTAVNFADHANKYTYIVTALSGKQVEWSVIIEELENPEVIQLSLIANTGDWDESVTVYSDLSYNNFLTRYSGWNGGDGCITLRLPDGSILWSFQDSFFGAVSQDRIREDNVFVRNAGFIQKDASLFSYVQLNPEGENGKAGTWIEYPGANENNDDHWYWGGPAQVVGGEVQMLLGQIVPGGFAGVHASTDVAVFTLPDMTFKQLVTNKYQGELSWDSGLFYAPDGYTYMYTSEGLDFCYSRMYAARVANHDLTGEWEYYTTDGWVATAPEDHTKYVVVAENHVTQPNVFKEGEKYYLVSQSGCFGLDINISESDSPTGPFINERRIYKIPEKYTSDSPQPPGYITYNAVVHHSLSMDGELVISYNINPIGFENNFNTPGSADNYRPYFVRVYNWK